MIIAGLLSGVVTWIFMYLDAKLFDTPKSKFTYFKGISFVVCITVAVVYFMSPRSTVMSTTAGYGVPAQIGGGGYGVTGVPMSHVGGYGGEEILTGMPPF